MSNTDRTSISEVWKDVIGFEGQYQVSNTGRVKSLSRIQYRGESQFRYPVPEKILKCKKNNKSGHLAVDLEKGNIRLVHRLVLEVFVGPCPEGMECCHEDGNPSNNILTNLRWDTKKSNAADRRKHGTAFNGPRGDTHPFAKVTANIVRKIREDYATGNFSLKDLSRTYHIHIMTLSNLINRVTWKHVP